MTPENSIFICYRRDDSNSATYSIADRLKLSFGEKAVFWDHAGFQGGDEWREKSRSIVPSAAAVVVVIHKDWINIGKDRLKDPNDPVRQELQMAATNPNCVIIPVTIDTTRSPGTRDLETISAAVGSSDEELLNLLGTLFAKTTLKIRFTKDFENDIQLLIRRLDDIPGLDQVGGSTSFDVSGLTVIRPSIAMPPHTISKTSKASDLWILQAKYRSIPMIGRDADFRSLMDWLDGEPRISARLLVGKAGAGKTRLGFEFLWEIFKEQAHLWDAGLVVADSMRKYVDWNAFTWRRPTVLMLDYALAIAEPVRQMFLALALKSIDGNLSPLRILLIEREASSEEGWFRTLLDCENSAGGRPVRELFEPPEPVALQPLETPELRRMLLDGVFQLAHAHDGRPRAYRPPARTLHLTSNWPKNVGAIRCT